MYTLACEKLRELAQQVEITAIRIRKASSEKHFFICSKHVKQEMLQLSKSPPKIGSFCLIVTIAWEQTFVFFLFLELP